MRTQLIVVSAFVLVPFLGACDNGDEDVIPRTVPPSSIGDAVVKPDGAPAKANKMPVGGTGPVYDI